LKRGHRRGFFRYHHGLDICRSGLCGPHCFCAGCFLRGNVMCRRSLPPPLAGYLTKSGCWRGDRRRGAHKSGFTPPVKTAFPANTAYTPPPVIANAISIRQTDNATWLRTAVKPFLMTHPLRLYYGSPRWKDPSPFAQVNTFIQHPRRPTNQRRTLLPPVHAFVKKNSWASLNYGLSSCFPCTGFLQYRVGCQGYLWTILERCVMFSKNAGIVFDDRTERCLAKAQTGRRVLRRNAWKR
jgi:hypothetical protein